MAEKVDQIINDNCISNNFHKRQVTNLTVDLEEKHKDSSYNFVDSTFVPKQVSLIPKKAPIGYNGEWDHIHWKPIPDIEGPGYSLFDEMDPTSICLGYLSDYYFLSTIGILAFSDPEHIKRLFTVKKINPHGIYGVWLCVDGVWKEVIVDHYMPVFIDHIEHQPSYSFSQTYKKSVWLQILEKAYAKAFKNYYNISGGDPLNCISTLTGAPCERITDLSDPNEVFDKLNDSNKSLYIIICTATPSKIGFESNPDVIVGNAYFIHDVVDEQGSKYYVVRDTNRIHQNENIEDEISGKLFKDKSVERIEHDRLSLYFNLIGICRLRKEFKHTWTEVDITRTSVFYMKVPEYAHTQISIHQTDIRLLEDDSDLKKIGYLKTRVVLAKITKNDLVFVGCRFQNTKEISFDKYLEEGAYLILLEVYCENTLRKKFNLSACSGVNNVSISQIMDDSKSTLFKKSELEIWKNAALVQSEGVSSEIDHPHAKLFMKSFQEYGINLIALKNLSSPIGAINVRQDVRIEENEGCDFSYNITNDERRATLMPTPQNIDIALIKANPNKSNRCRFKYSTSNVYKSDARNPDRKAEFIKNVTPVWDRFEKYYERDFNNTGGACSACALI